MENSLLNIKKVSLIFFIITGLIHLVSSMFIANAIFLKEAAITNKVTDIPFIITGLIYALSSLRLQLSDPESEHKKLDFFLISIIISVLIALIAVNLAFPDLQ